MTDWTHNGIKKVLKEATDADVEEVMRRSLYHPDPLIKPQPETTPSPPSAPESPEPSR